MGKAVITTVAAVAVIAAVCVGSIIKLNRER